MLHAPLPANIFLQVTHRNAHSMQVTSFASFKIRPHVKLDFDCAGGRRGNGASGRSRGGQLGQSRRASWLRHLPPARSPRRCKRAHGLLPLRHRCCGGSPRARIPRPEEGVVSHASPFLLPLFILFTLFYIYTRTFVVMLRCLLLRECMQQH